MTRVNVDASAGPPERSSASELIDDDAAPIQLGPTAPHQAASGQPIDQLHRGVVPDLQSLGQRADRRRPAALEAFHLQEHDVLLRLDARGTCSFLADAEKAPDVIAQIGQRLVVHSRRGPAARGSRTHPRRTVSPRDNSPCDISAGAALGGRVERRQGMDPWNDLLDAAVGEYRRRNG